MAFRDGNFSGKFLQRQRTAVSGAVSSINMVSSKKLFRVVKGLEKSRARFVEKVRGDPDIYL
jgi:hypothetical protein